MRLKVVSTQVFERDITSKAGKAYRFREQEAVVELGVERRIVLLSLERDQAPYPQGEYDVLWDQSVEIDRNRKLALKRQLAVKPFLAAAVPRATQG